MEFLFRGKDLKRRGDLWMWRALLFTIYAHRIAVITFALSANGEILMGSNPIVHKMFFEILEAS